MKNQTFWNVVIAIVLCVVMAACLPQEAVQTNSPLEQKTVVGEQLNVSAETSAYWDEMCAEDDPPMIQITVGQNEYPQYALGEEREISPLGVLFDYYYWGTAPPPAVEDCTWRIDLSSQEACFTFYENGPYVRYVCGESTLWYVVEPLYDRDEIAQAIRAQYDSIEASYRNASLTLPEDRDDYTTSEIAELYLEMYLGRWENLAPGSSYAITDFEVLERRVFVPRDGSVNMIGIVCRYAVCPVVYDFVGWWAGNAFAADGKDDWVGKYSELLIESLAGDGQTWVCTDMGTGGLKLGGENVYNGVEVFD